MKSKTKEKTSLVAVTVALAFSVGLSFGISLPATSQIPVVTTGSTASTSSTTTTTTTRIQKTVVRKRIDRNKAPNQRALEAMLRGRQESVAELIDKAYAAGQISEEDKSGFQTSLRGAAFKIEAKRSNNVLNTNRAIEIASDFDSLALRVASQAHMRLLPNLIVINDLRGTSDSVMERPDEQVQISTVKPKDFLMLIQERARLLKHVIAKSPNVSEHQLARFRDELSQLKALDAKRADMAKDDPNSAVPVAIAYDALGKRILGVVTSYELLPLTPIPITNSASSASAGAEGDLTAKKMKIEATLYDQVADKEITPPEAAKMRSELAAINGLEKEYRADGKLTDSEHKKIKTALDNVKQRLSMSGRLN